MPPKPLSEEQKEAYKRHVRDKTAPLRLRFFSESLMTVLLWIGVLALAGYGGFYAWSLMRAQASAQNLEQKLQEKIKETQRDMQQ
jgi:hypothetical protein